MNEGSCAPGGHEVCASSPPRANGAVWHAMLGEVATGLRGAALRIAIRFIKLFSSAARRRKVVRMVYAGLSDVKYRILPRVFFEKVFYCLLVAVVFWRVFVL